MDILPLPQPHSLTVFRGPSNAEPVTQLIVELALRGPVTVLVGGNRLPAFHLIRLISERTPDPSAAEKRTFTRRAFTCYQMEALLEATPALAQPYVLLDLLATFYDEQIPIQEVRRLLDGCLRQIERLCHTSPVLVTSAPAPTAERACLVEQLCARAGHLFALAAPALPLLQPTLF